MKTFIVMHFTYNFLFRFATIKKIYNNLWFQWQFYLASLNIIINKLLDRETRIWLLFI